MLFPSRFLGVRRTQRLLERQHVGSQAAGYLFSERVVIGPLQLSIQRSLVLLDPRMVKIVKYSRFDASPVMNRHESFLPMVATSDQKHYTKSSQLSRLIFPYSSSPLIRRGLFGGQYRDHDESKRRRMKKGMLSDSCSCGLKPDVRIRP